MIKRSKNMDKYLNNHLLKNLSVVFSESIVTKALSFVVILFLSRTLGPTNYGKYSYIFVAVAFSSAFFDFGMENTAVRFSAKDKDKTNPIFGLYLLVKIVIVAILLVVLAIFGQSIFSFLGKTEIVSYIPYLMIGFLGESLLFVNDTYLQAIQRFKARAVINISRYVVSVIFILLLYDKQIIILKYVCLLYFLPMLLAFMFLLKYLNFLKEFFVNKLPIEKMKEMLHYEKWMLLVSIPNNTLGRIDFFLIAYWATYEQIGIYNAAFQLSSIVSFIPFAFGKVMLPKMSELDEFKVFEYTNKIMKVTLYFCGAMLFLVPLARPIIPFVLGQKYLESIPILQIMLISAIIAFALTPIEQAIYSIGKPMFITVGKYVQIAAIVLMIFGTVPYFGFTWAAISVAIARLTYGIILMSLYFRYKKSYLILGKHLQGEKRG